MIAGQGTAALEILEELATVRAMHPPGGRRRAARGIRVSLLRAVAPAVRIVGVQGTRSNAMARALEAGKLVPVSHERTLADGLSGDIDDFALDVGKHSLDVLAIVTEEEIAMAIAWLSREEGLVVEGSGAVGVAALLAEEDLQAEGSSGGRAERRQHRLGASRGGRGPPLASWRARGHFGNEGLAAVEPQCERWRSVAPNYRRADRLHRSKILREQNGGVRLSSRTLDDDCVSREVRSFVVHELEMVWLGAQADDVRSSVHRVGDLPGIDPVGRGDERPRASRSTQHRRECPREIAPVERFERRIALGEEGGRKAIGPAQSWFPSRAQR